jgi:uncharacterized protein (DUF1015 family)
VARIACPPYDVVTTAQARELAEGKPESFLHVTRPEIDLAVDVDVYSDDVYARGRANLLRMVEDELLVQDAEPRLYVYAQAMGEHRQIGVVACASVAEYDGNLILKHEKTRPDKENDRTRHIQELGAHDEPVFLTYRAQADIDELVAAASQAAASYDFRSDDGVHHQLWVLDQATSGTLAQAFAGVPALYVADGHHRSAAASRVHQALAGDGAEHDAFLAVIFPHDQMNILAYNRIVRDAKKRSGAELIAALAEVGDLQMVPDAAPTEAGSFGVYVDGAWYRLSLHAGSDEAASGAVASGAVAALDCALCQDRILEPIFGISDPRRDEHLGFVGGIHGAAELERRIDSGDWSLALYLFPTSMLQVMAVSDAGEVMPPKSTWFEPKLRSGLFVHTF